MTRMLLALTMAMTVAACAEEDKTRAFCTAFPAATVHVLDCDAGCTDSGNAMANDRDLGTTATITPVNGQVTYTATLTATAPATIPSGADVGVFITQPSRQNFQTMNSTLRTLDGGVEVEVLNAGNDVTSPAESGTPAAGFLGMRTTQEFDQLEFKATLTWGAGQAPVYYVYEVCLDGGNV